MFKVLEGIDIHPAAAIAVSTLIKAVADSKLTMNDVVMLNITGGGEERFKQDKELHYLKPSIVFDVNPDKEEVKKEIKSLFKEYL